MKTDKQRCQRKLNIEAAREMASELVDEDPTLADHPDLASAIDRYLGDDRAEFLERG